MNLEEIKRRKLEDLQGSMNEQQEQSFNEQLELQQQIKTLEDISKKYLTKEAIERYCNLKSAHQETAIKVIAIIAQLAQAGQLNEKLDDEKFKTILQQIQGQKRDFKIRRK